MSQSTSIDITAEENIDFLKVLEGFINTGWNFNDYGKITYVPPGDEEDWVSDKLENETSVIKIIREKIELGEHVGIVIMWQNTMIGGLLVFWPKKSRKRISFLAELNRQTLKAHPAMCGIGDFTWYIEKLLLPFIDQKIHVFGVEASDYC